MLRAEISVLFEHTHVEPGVIITWTLTGTSEGCSFVLTQTVPDRASAINNNFVVGLHTSLDHLGSLLQRRPIDWGWDVMGEHQRRYAKRPRHRFAGVRDRSRDHSDQLEAGGGEFLQLVVTVERLDGANCARS